MNRTPDKSSSIHDKARELLDSRMESIKNLTHTRDQLDQARDKLVAAQKSDNEAYKTAISAGWTPSDLSSLGIEAPEISKKNSRPRQNRRSPDGPNRRRRSVPEATSQQGQTQPEEPEKTINDQTQAVAAREAAL